MKLNPYDSPETAGLRCETGSKSTAALLVVGVALILPTIITFVYFILLNGAPAVLQQTAYGFGKIVQFSLPAIWVLLIQRERLKWNRPPVWSLVTGASFGIAVGLAMVVMYFHALKPSGMLDESIAVVRTKIQSFGVSSPLGYFFLAVFYSAVHSLLEEYYWRWFVFRQLGRFCRLPSAIAISSIGFAAHHVLVLGLYFGYVGPTAIFTVLFSLAIVIGARILGVALSRQSIARRSVGQSRIR